MKNFKCPKCGSEYFKTVWKNGEIHRGRCKGRFVGTYMDRKYSGCDFTWLRSEDEKYFVDQEPNAETPVYAKTYEQGKRDMMAKVLREVRKEKDALKSMAKLNPSVASHYWQDAYTAQLIINRLQLLADEEIK